MPESRWVLVAVSLLCTVAGTGCSSSTEDIGDLTQELGACSALSVTVSPPGPQVANTVVVLDASAAGCTNPRFLFDSQRKNDDGTWGPWSLLERGTSDVAVVGYGAGTYRLRVRAKEAGAPTWQARKVVTYQWLCPEGLVQDGEECLPPSECSLDCEGENICCETAEGGHCVDYNTDASNCGRCGNVCSGGQLCESGGCECAYGLTLCDGECVNVRFDSDNCGWCGSVCPPGERLCRNAPSGGPPIAACMPCAAAGPSWAECDNECTDLNNEVQNCGACGVACASGETCELGVCTPD